MKRAPSLIIVPCVLIVAFLLTLLPMPGWTVWLRPAWVLMVLIYWTMNLPYRMNVGFAWFIGILLDVLTGTLLGEHAIALSIVIYLVVRWDSRLRMFLMLQQALCVMLLVFLYQFILFCVQGFIGQLPKSPLYWACSFTSMIVWPWIWMMLENMRRRFRVV